MTFSIDNPEGGCNNPLRKICLGKTLRKTRVKQNFLSQLALFFRQEKPIQLSDYFMAVQYETSQFNYLYDHAWIVQLRHILFSDCHLVR